jgi:hypothetical protein
MAALEADKFLANLEANGSIEKMQQGEAAE